MMLRRLCCLAFLWPALATAQVGPNIDELAKQLANPGAANAALNFRLEFRGFDGEIMGGLDRLSTSLTFQPVLPFVLSNGNNLIFRPAFSYGWGQPRAKVTPVDDVTRRALLQPIR